jgi:hypothetical protein
MHRLTLPVALLSLPGLAATAPGSCPALSDWRNDVAATPRWLAQSDSQVQIADEGSRVFDAALTSPRIALPAQGLDLRWRQRVQLSWANSAGVLEIQLDHAPWQDFTAAGGHFLRGAYDSRAFAGNPLGARPAWGGEREDKEIHAVLAPGHTITSVRLRFRFGSSGTGDTRPGWVIAALHCAAAG